MPVSVFESVTLAFLMTACCESRTVPVTVPDPICAYPPPAISESNNPQTRQKRVLVPVMTNLLRKPRCSVEAASCRKPRQGMQPPLVARSILFQPSNAQDLDLSVSLLLRYYCGLSSTEPGRGER